MTTNSTTTKTKAKAKTVPVDQVFIDTRRSRPVVRLILPEQASLEVMGAFPKKRMLRIPSYKLEGYSMLIIQDYSRPPQFADEPDFTAEREFVLRAISKAVGKEFELAPQSNGSEF